MQLTESLASMTQAESEKFFFAHGLDDAYRKPGAWSSKALKVTSALREAKARGGDFYVHLLGEAERFSTKSGRGEALGSGQRTVSNDRSIFISHATHDKILADELRRLLLLGGVPNDQIFYSSQRSTGIPSGESIPARLRSTLLKSTLVIELVSRNFLARPYCLMEMGAAWALEKDTYPVVVPPLSLGEAIQAVGDIRMAFLGDESDVDALVDELHERLEKIPGISLPLQQWNYAGREFKSFWVRHRDAGQ
ncbi:TIR domain-containing protein [Kitasatospora sp. NPDC087314]|uniref:TIR domain-containing protein n=1 Tax=Kitasatospora sp. NPDC087314 TaxID=3364068 RepID=UPI0038017A5F